MNKAIVVAGALALCLGFVIGAQATLVNRSGRLIGPIPTGLLLNDPYIEKQVPGIRSVIACDLVTGTLFVAALLYAASRFFRRKKGTPQVMIAIYILQLAIVLFTAFWTRTAVGVAADFSGQLVRAILSAAIWIPYFSVSKRVRETFVVP